MRKLLGSRRRRIALALFLGLPALGVASIFVVSNFPVVPTLEGCIFLRDSDKRKNCIADRGEDLVRDRGFTRGLQEVERQARDHALIEAECHHAMHKVGKRTYKSLKVGFSRAKKVSGTCTDGFRHAMVSEAIKSGKPSDFRTAASACEEMLAEKIDDHLMARQCFHGLGHGFRKAYSDSKAEAACRDYISAEPGRVKCYGGVLMDNSFRLTSTQLKKGRIDYCNTKTGGVAIACWTFLAIPQGLTVAAAMKFCEKANYQPAKDICYYNSGRSFAAIERDPCTTAPKGSAFDSCIAGFLRGNVYDARQLDPEDAVNLCETFSSSEEAACAEHLGQSLRLLATSKRNRRSHCASFASKESVTICRGGYDGPVSDTMDTNIA